jgi:hypothetical protein
LIHIFLKSEKKYKKIKLVFGQSDFLIENSFLLDWVKSKERRNKFLKKIKSVFQFDAYFPGKWGKQNPFYVIKINLTDTHLLFLLYYFEQARQ